VEDPQVLGAGRRRHPVHDAAPGPRDRPGETVTTKAGELIARRLPADRRGGIGSAEADEPPPVREERSRRRHRRGRRGRLCWHPTRWRLPGQKHGAARQAGEEQRENGDARPEEGGPRVLWSHYPPLARTAGATKYPWRA